MLTINSKESNDVRTKLLNNYNIKLHTWYSFKTHIDRAVWLTLVRHYIQLHYFTTHSYDFLCERELLRITTNASNEYVIQYRRKRHEISSSFTGSTYLGSEYIPKVYVDLYGLGDITALKIWLDNKYPKGFVGNPQFQLQSQPVQRKRKLQILFNEPKKTTTMISNDTVTIITTTDNFDERIAFLEAYYLHTMARVGISKTQAKKHMAEVLNKARRIKPKQVE